MATARVRKTVHFSGRVQGVGFRFRTARLAERFAVEGFVENLPDGRVRLVIEADQAEAKRFVAAVGQEMGRLIDATNENESLASGEFAGFGIRR